MSHVAWPGWHRLDWASTRCLLLPPGLSHLLGNLPAPRVSVLRPFSTSAHSLVCLQPGRDHITATLNPFVLAAVTNRHKLGALKQHKFFSSSSGGQKSNMGFSELKSRYRQSCIPFWRLQGRICSLPFPASRGCPHSLAGGPLLPR